MDVVEDTSAAIVTGAARGIGRAVAETLVRQGMRVVMTDLPIPELDSAAKDLARIGGTVRAVPADITDPGQVAGLVDAACRAFGPPRVLVNNAGWTRVDSFLNSTEEFRRRLIDINFLGPARVTHTVAKMMVDEKVADARIIFVSSDAGRVGSGGEAVYAGAKGGLISFAKSLAREFARYGISVNAVAPGPIDTRLYQQMEERRKEAIIRGIPMRKVGQPADVAGAVAYFAGRNAGYVTGQVVSVSGGLTMAG